MESPFYFKLQRKYKKANYTIGLFYVQNTFFQTSLEDTDRGLTQDMTEDQILKKKVYGKTAIPTGTYEIKLTYSPKFASRPWAKKYRGLVPELIGVKGYSGVRIHPLNRPEDTYGCIGIGENKVKGQIVNSTYWYEKLMNEYIWPFYIRNRKMYITIE